MAKESFVVDSGRNFPLLISHLRGNEHVIPGDMLTAGHIQLLCVRLRFLKPEAEGPFALGALACVRLRDGKSCFLRQHPNLLLCFQKVSGITHR